MVNGMILGFRAVLRMIWNFILSIVAGQKRNRNIHTHDNDYLLSDYVKATGHPIFLHIL